MEAPMVRRCWEHQVDAIWSNVGNIIENGRSRVILKRELRRRRGKCGMRTLGWMGFARGQVCQGRGWRPETQVFKGIYIAARC